MRAALLKLLIRPPLLKLLAKFLDPIEPIRRVLGLEKLRIVFDLEKFRMVFGLVKARPDRITFDEPERSLFALNRATLGDVRVERFVTKFLGPRAPLRIVLG